MTYTNRFALAAFADNALPPWWEKIDEDPRWQEYSFLGLAVGYGLIAFVAIVQLIRIQKRVPEYGWTTQKVFHLLNAFVCVLRCVVFALREKVCWLLWPLDRVDPFRCFSGACWCILQPVCLFWPLWVHDHVWQIQHLVHSIWDFILHA